MKKDVIIINTSRGEIINEDDLINFLKKNPRVKYAADVISNEVNSKKNKLLYFYKKNYMKKNIIITPHVGGMTTEAQLLAYNASFKQIYNFFFDV
jgi:D-3-phosphoglycerate dehydrogenase